MKKWILLFFILFITACCQPEGNYKECVENGGSLCIDFYPKCKCDSEK